MTYPKSFPGARWVGSKRDGKPWIGVTKPMVVIHTLEFNAWPDPERWDSPTHLVVNPNTSEIRQYLPMDKAAYAVRDNPLEDDAYTWQVEMWGRAAHVPGYNDRWYRGVGEMCQVFIDEYDIPLNFADFTIMQYGAYAPQRMDHGATDAFTGFLGHAHMGRGVDEHWDPGRLDVSKVMQYMRGEAVDYARFVAGWVEGLAEDPAKARQEFTRLNTEQQSDGNYILEPANRPAAVDYWMEKLSNPYDDEWPGFYARTQLSVWGR